MDVGLAELSENDEVSGSDMSTIDVKGKLYIATFSEDAIRCAREYGVGLEINHTCISEVLDEANREKLLAEIRADAAAAGVAKCSEPVDPADVSSGPMGGRRSGLMLHGPFTEIHPSAIDYRVRELGMERLNQTYDVCAALGVNRMVVHTGWLPFIYFKNWYVDEGSQFWQKFMADKPSDFNIYIENVLEDEPHMLLDLVKRIDDPRVELCLDIGHANAMTQADISVETWIETLGSYIGHFHLHNNDGSGDSHGDFDCGSMDMERILSKISECCPSDATLTIEARDARSCLEWLAAHEYIK